MRKLIRRHIEGIVGRRSQLEPEFMEIWERCAPFTMTGIKRAHGLWLACKYIVDAAIPGDLVECGVWRGGSAMIMAHTLLQLRETRQIYLFDTFEGMVEPTDADVSFDGRPARSTWIKKRHGMRSGWCEASLEDVRSNMAATGYPLDATHFIKGRVEDTLPSSRHSQIAVLRLDTDWYESTALELKLLYPLLQQGGVLIVDDYGHWRGSRRAVDEYFGGKLLLARLDYTGRMAVKT